MKIQLPWPPSNNKYYRHNRGRTHISHEGIKYRNLVYVHCLEQKMQRFGGSRVTVRIIACPPNRIRRDLDNLIKAVFDALTHAFIWEDDHQVYKLALEWGEVVKDGCLLVTINKIEGE